MAEIITAPINYAVIAGGDFVSGGAVVFGVENVKPDTANPATLKSVYLDSALLTEAQNPQPLNSSAVFNQATNGVLYGADNDKYSIVIYDRNGAELSYIPSYNLSDANAALDAQQSASEAAASAGEAAASETNAKISEDAAKASLNEFVDQYWGAYATEPALSPIGNPATVGDLYFNTTDNSMKVYDGAVWGNVGSSVNGLRDEFSISNVAGQDTFLFTYDPDYVDVFYNGVKLLKGIEYDASSGTQIVLATPVKLSTDVINAVAYNNVDFINMDEALVTARGTTEPRALADRFGDSVNAKDFGVVADGVTDDSIAMNAFIAHLKSNGLRGQLPSGTIIARDLRLESGVLPWSMYGYGKGITTIVSPDGTGTTIIGTAGSTVGYSIGDFTLDCNRTGGGASPNHGISIAGTSNVLFERIHVINYANSAILSYEDAAAYSDVTYSECSCDGGDFAGNGFLIEKCLRPRIINCDAANILVAGGNGPGYGLQFKNDCVDGLISGGSASRCVVGVAFGFELGGVGVTNSIVSDVVATDCTSGLLVKGNNNRMSMTIDMDSSGESAIDVQDGSKYNHIDGTVLNVASSKGAVRFRENTEDNFASLDVHGLVLNSSRYALSDANSLRNSVVVNSYTSSDIPANGYRVLSNFSGTTNRLVVNGITPLHSFLPIASGNVTLDNAAYKVLKVDTEGGSPITNLNNILGTPSDGDSILITPVNDARTINVTNSGNIVTLTGADTPLDTQYKIMKLMWRSGPDRWVEH